MQRKLSVTLTQAEVYELIAALAIHDEDLDKRLEWAGEDKAKRLAEVYTNRLKAARSAAMRLNQALEDGEA